MHRLTHTGNLSSSVAKNIRVEPDLNVFVSVADLLKIKELVAFISRIHRCLVRSHTFVSTRDSYSSSPLGHPSSISSIRSPGELSLENPHIGGSSSQSG
jgi:hypothetical protein